MWNWAKCILTSLSLYYSFLSFLWEIVKISKTVHFVWLWNSNGLYMGSNSWTKQLLTCMDNCSAHRNICDNLIVFSLQCYLLKITTLIFLNRCKTDFKWTMIRYSWFLNNTDGFKQTWVYLGFFSNQCILQNCTIWSWLNLRCRTFNSEGPVADFHL